MRGSPWRGGGLFSSFISFMGFPHTPRLVCMDPLGTYGALAITDAQASLCASWLDVLQPLVPRPLAPDGSAGEAARPPHQALHLKEISWDHQKPATLIAGILFLVSLDELLQVF